MNLEAVTKGVGHTCRQRDILLLAEGIGLSEPWTQADVDALRAVVRFNPGTAARQVGIKAQAFIEHADELGFERPYLYSEIHAVRDAITPDFPGMTSEQIARRMNIGVGWIRRYAREFEIGKWADGGCYMIDGERKRRARPSRSFVKSDIQLFLDVFPSEETEKRFPLNVAMADYALACEKATGTEKPADIMSMWVKEGAAAARDDG